MKRPYLSNPDLVFRIYSKLFSVLILILLISFVPLSSFTPASLSTNFRWRSDLINMYTFLRLRLGDRVFNNAVIGKEGWIFYTGETSIPDYQNTDRLKQKTLTALQKDLSRLGGDLDRIGVILLVVIPPNKSTIYSQYMPDEIPIIGAQSRLDQFVEYMRLHSDIPIIDLRPTLRQASQELNVYFKTDSHWNHIGAYHGYVAVMNSLSSAYPELAARPLSDFEYGYTGGVTTDLPRIMGLSNWKEESWVLKPKFEVNLKENSEALPDGIHYIRTVRNSVVGLPSLLVYSDSFYGSLSYFIEPHFSKVKSIPFTNNTQVWSLEWIQLEQPDIVIIEVVERYLDSGLSALMQNDSKGP